MLSGAVLDPTALRELVPDFESKGAPLSTVVRHDRVYFLTERSKVRFPITPPPLRNHGHFIVSLQRMDRWLSILVEAEGVDVFSGFAGVDLLMDGARVVGVRTGDRGVDRHGKHKDSFEPGVDIRAKVTILAEGVRGNLTKQLPGRAAAEPHLFSLGLKELWDVPEGRIPEGSVIHTMGYPLRMEEFGGGFIYAMPKGRVSVGFVAGLEYRDPSSIPTWRFNGSSSIPS